MKKPRIAIYYHNNFGRHDGPPLYYWNAMKEMGLDVTHLIPQGDIYKEFGKFDLHFWVDYGEDGLPVDHTWRIPLDGGKTVYVVSDAHLDNGYRFNKAKEFDYVFFNQRKFLEEYTTQESQSVHFLPHAAEPKAYPKYEILKKYDVCFIGHLQDVENYNGITRVNALDRIFKEFPNFYFGTRNPQKPEVNMFEDASRKFCQSRIAFNISIKDDLNMRFFEILSSGSFQLTNWIPILKDMEKEYGLKDGKHFVTYKTLDEAVEKAKYYIEHEEEREKIALAGHKKFLEAHTYQSRISKILDTVKLPDNFKTETSKSERR